MLLWIENNSECTKALGNVLVPGWPGVETETDVGVTLTRKEIL